MKLLRTALGALGAISIGLVIRNATRTLANFSQEMSTVRAISGATGETFEALQAKARDLGATTRFSATQAAEGMTFLARAGFDTDAVMASIGPTLQLAQAGALELGRAADIASNVLTGFNIEAKDSQRVIDVLALAANSANTNVEQLGQAMSFVAPIASSLGVSVEETTAAVQTLSDAGIQASRAGTNLTMVMRRLQAPAGSQAKIIKELGLELEDVRVSEVGLTTAFERLRDAGISQEQTFRLFGRTAAAASVLLTGVNGKVQEFTKANMAAEGTAAEVARVMDDNLNGALLKVRSAWEELQLAVGSAGAESALTKVFTGLANLLRNIAANIDQIVDPVKDLFNFLKDVAVSTVQALTPAFWAIVDAFTAWGVTGESLKWTIEDLGLLLVSLLQTAAQVTDGAISSFNILGKVIATAVFGGIQDAKHFWAQGLHSMTESFKDMINSVIRAYNNAIVKIGGDPLPFLKPELAPTTKGFEWGKAMGDAVTEGWMTPVSDVLEDIISRIEDSQLQRQLEELRAAAGGGGGAGAGGTAGGAMHGPFQQGAPTPLLPPDMLDDAAKGIGDVTESASLMEKGVREAFDGATRALVDFVQTGKFEVRQFAADVLQQISRLAAQQLFSGIPIPGFGGGKAAGGPVSGGTPYLVGERGPELMVPNGSGTIVPNNQLAAPGATPPPSVAAPQMNVKVINVLDPSTVTEAMNSEAGEEVIINVISRNSSTVAQAVS